MTNMAVEVALQNAGVKFVRAAVGEDYPSHPVRIVVGFPAGAAGDLVSRALATYLSRALGQQFQRRERDMGAAVTELFGD